MTATAAAMAIVVKQHLQNPQQHTTTNIHQPQQQTTTVTNNRLNHSSNRLNQPPGLQVWGGLDEWQRVLAAPSPSTVAQRLLQGWGPLGTLKRAWGRLAACHGAVGVMSVFVILRVKHGVGTCWCKVWNLDLLRVRIVRCIRMDSE